MTREDCISRESIKRKLQEHHDFFIHAYNGFSNMPQNDKSRVDEINNCIAMVVNEPSVTPQPCEDCISREDALMALTGDITDCTIEEFIARLRDKLSKLPSVGKDINVTTNKDCISRQAVLDEINRIGIKAFETYNDYSELYDFVDGLPSVTPKENTGHWIENAPEYQNIDPPYICSECGNMHLRKTNYCDQCGTRMVDPQESKVSK